MKLRVKLLAVQSIEPLGDRASSFKSYSTNRLLKKTHLLCCARSPRSNVLASTPPLVDFSRASQLTLLTSLCRRVFNTPLTWH
jgi:hypothetical protein